MKFTKKAENVGEKSNIVSYQHESVKIMRVYLQFFDGGGEEIVGVKAVHRDSVVFFTLLGWGIVRNGLLDECTPISPISS